MRASLERALTWALAAVLVVAILGTVAIAVNPPQTTEPYTEFYVLNAEGEAEQYPDRLAVGETGTVLVGVANHEREQTSYTVVARLGDRVVTERSVTLAIDERWEEEVSVTPRDPGRTQLRLLLYRGSPDSATEPYRQVRVQINVTSSS